MNEQCKLNPVKIDNPHIKSALRKAGVFGVTGTITRADIVEKTVWVKFSHNDQGDKIQENFPLDMEWIVTI